MSVGTLAAVEQPWGDLLDCPNRPVSVEVESVEIPVSYVETEITKEGPASINRLTEVRFPAEFNGIDVTQYIDSFDPSNQDVYDDVLVKWRGENQSEYTDTHFGYVRGVAGTDNSLEMRMWVSDPATLTTAIPYTQTFGDDATSSDVLRDVASVFEAQTPFSPVRIESNLDIAGEEISEISDEDNIKTSFTGNRDVLKDALDAVSEVTFSWWYFEWRNQGLTLVLDQTPYIETSDVLIDQLSEEQIRNIYEFLSDDDRYRQVQTVRGLNESWVRDNFGDVDIQIFEDGELSDEEREQIGLSPASNISTRTNFVDEETFASDVSFNPDEEITLLDNDAINEILPVNALRSNGKTSGSSSGASFGGTSRQWPTAKVRYRPLYERAGNNEYQTSIQETDTRTIDATVNAARTKLKEALQSTGEGDMTVKGTPSIRPHDRIAALPACAEYLNQNPPLDYEVTSVRHEADAMAGAIYRTQLDVTLFVDESEIETVDARMASN